MTDTLVAIGKAKATRADLETAMEPEKPEKVSDDT